MTRVRLRVTEELLGEDDEMFLPPGYGWSGPRVYLPELRARELTVEGDFGAVPEGSLVAAEIVMEVAGKVRWQWRHDGAPIGPPIEIEDPWKPWSTSSPSP